MDWPIGAKYTERLPRRLLLLLVIIVTLGLVAAVPTVALAQSPTDQAPTSGENALGISNGHTADTVPVSQETKRCMRCHNDNHPGMVDQYEESAHYDAGVGCLDCHSAADDEPTAEKHFDSVISQIVTPEDCAECHQDETGQFHDSMHDEAAFYSASTLSNVDNGSDVMPTGWNNNVLVHNSRASAEAGCQECHGAELRVMNDMHPNAPEEDVKIQGHPNQGIGRFNPDGSIGSCAACHPQHRFSLEQARKPGSCTECHLGPDHPQKEIYEESKHASMFHNGVEEFNLESDQLTTEDITAPSCAVCHMSGLGEAGQTHDVSSRLKWEAEPVYSYPTSREYETGEERFAIKKDVATNYELKYGLESGTVDSVPTGAPNPFAALESNRPDLYRRYVVENDELYPEIDAGDEPTRWASFDGESQISAETKRDRMKAVCTECHTEGWVNNEFVKRDEVIHLYNAIYVASGVKYYEPIKDKAPKAAPYDRSWVDQIRFEMWHHEGRRWRMGALMKGQDYQHWHGSYNVLGDVLKLAHAKSVIENTAVGGAPDADTTQESSGETESQSSDPVEEPSGDSVEESGDSVQESGDAVESSQSSSAEIQTKDAAASMGGWLPAGLGGIGAGIVVGIAFLGLAAVGLGKRR